MAKLVVGVVVGAGSRAMTHRSMMATPLVLRGPFARRMGVLSMSWYVRARWSRLRGIMEMARDVLMSKRMPSAMKGPMRIWLCPCGVRCGRPQMKVACSSLRWMGMAVPELKCCRTGAL